MDSAFSKVNFALLIDPRKIVDTSVGVHDGGQITDSLGEGGFGLVMLSVEGGSLVKGRLSEAIKDIHNGVNGVSSLFLKLEELHHLVVNAQSRLTDGDEDDE